MNFPRKDPNPKIPAHAPRRQADYQLGSGSRVLRVSVDPIERFGATMIVIAMITNLTGGTVGILIGHYILDAGGCGFPGVRNISCVRAQAYADGRTDGSDGAGCPIEGRQ